MTETFLGVNLRHAKIKIKQALSFWGESLCSVLPKKNQIKFIVAKEQITVKIIDEKAYVSIQAKGQTSDAGVFECSKQFFDGQLVSVIKERLSEDYNLVLEISDGTVLSKKIDLPASVEENLQQTLLYEMDKHSPFPKENILYDATITRRIGNRIEVMLFILHRNQVQFIVDHFQQNNVKFDRLCSASETTINLLPETMQRPRPIFSSWRVIFLFFVFLVLMIACLAAPLYFKRLEATHLEKMINSFNQQASGEIELWEKRDNTEKVISDFIDAYPISFAQIHEELAKKLPDDTWIRNLVYQNGNITIRGESKNAAKMVSIINKSHLFKNTKIISPIVKSRQTANKEAYHIAFQIVSGAPK